MRFFFRKNEKLTSENEIELLFKSGKSNFIYPIKVLFLISSTSNVESKVLITASKRYLRKATERNLVKRRMRESYRLNLQNLKQVLIERNANLTIAFIYTSSKIISYNKIDTIIAKHVLNIISILEKREGEN
jgi:ribonuclease P protein component